VLGVALVGPPVIVGATVAELGPVLSAGWLALGAGAPAVGWLPVAITAGSGTAAGVTLAVGGLAAGVAGVPVG
jgi:hypothetical protein